MTEIMNSYWSESKIFLTSCLFSILMIGIVGVLNSSALVLWPISGILSVMIFRCFAQYKDTKNMCEDKASNGAGAIYLIGGLLFGPAVIVPLLVVIGLQN